MFKYLGRFVSGHPWICCIIWAVTGILLLVIVPSPRIVPPNDVHAMLPQNCDSMHGKELLERAFPQLLEKNADSSSSDSTGLAAVVIAAILFSLLFLTIYYRAPLLALAPVTTAALSGFLALQLAGLFALCPGVVLDDIGTTLTFLLAYALAVSYCLALIRRYRDELAEGQSRVKAIKRAIATTGRPLAVSAGVLMGVLGILLMASTVTVRSAGPVFVLSVATALLASLTLAPALLRLLGRKDSWPELWSVSARNWRWQDWWDRICDLVISRPVPTCVLAVLLLSPLAFVGLWIKPTCRPAESSSSQAIVLLTSHSDWNSQQSKEAISHLCHAIAHLDNVAEVRSLAQSSAAVGQPHAISADDFVSKVASRDDSSDEPLYVARLMVSFRSAPLTAESLATQRLIQTWIRDRLSNSVQPLTDVSGECYSAEAEALDLAKATTRDRTLLTIIIAIGGFLAFLAMMRNAWRAAYLLFIGLLTSYAALGASALILSLVLGQTLNDIEWRAWPILLSIILTAGADYGMRPVLRAWLRTQGNADQLWDVLSRRAGTTLIAGTVSIGLFASLLLAGSGALMQIGLALTLGLLINVLIVRPFLVPASMLMIGKVLKKLAEADRRETELRPKSRKRVA